ncbi:MAG: DUF1059 domain-containing protein [Flavobacteriales bacterium]|nr:DUF1059 domain-containing protein [Flavobacteriales bacterium]
MKKMTCKQLGGACNQVFEARTFKEIVKLSKKHGMEMFKAGDKSHINAMQKMQEIMEYPDLMKEWLEDKQAEFNEL